MRFRVDLIKYGEPDDEAQSLGERDVVFHGREIRIQHRPETYVVPDLSEIVEGKATTLLDCTKDGEKFTLHLTPLDGEAKEALTKFLSGLKN